MQFLHGLVGCKQVYRVAVLKQAGRTHGIGIPSQTVAARTIGSGLQSARFKVRQFSNPGLIIKVGNIFQDQIWILNVGFPSTIVFLLPSFDESQPAVLCCLELKCRVTFRTSDEPCQPAGPLSFRRAAAYTPTAPGFKIALFASSTSHIQDEPVT